MTTDEIKEYELLKKKNDLEIYAMQFWKRLDEEVFHKSLPVRGLPLQIQLEEFDDKLKQKDLAAGRTLFYPMADGNSYICIVIYLNPYTNIDEVQQTIRHELLHLSLMVTGLKYSDFDAIFKILCERYDSRFYKKISGFDEILYEQAKPLTDQAFTIMDEHKNSVVNCQVGELIYTIGSTDVTETNLQDTIQKAKKILDELNIYCKYIDEQKQASALSENN